MLISPLMGPILAGVFGSVIGDRRLRNQGIFNELVSLGICIVVGFVLGLMVCPWIEVRVRNRYTQDERVRLMSHTSLVWVG